MLGENEIDLKNLNLNGRDFNEIDELEELKKFLRHFMSK